MGRSEKIPCLLFGKLTSTLIPFHNRGYRPWVTIPSIAAAQSLGQEAIGLHTFNPQCQHRFRAEVLDGETTIDGRALAEATGGRGIINWTEGNNRIPWLGKFLQRSCATSGIPRGERARKHRVPYSGKRHESQRERAPSAFLLRLLWLQQQVLYVILHE